ncbi:MAG TPA: hypothetical protein VM680_16095 [Verrucomicrobiae bacterium]|nr:hypothetical protein [Verrucomicrobiae bacterium]
MNAQYDKLGAALGSIRPRNERARTWLNKLLLHCLENSRRELDQFANAASVQALQYDFDILMHIQGDDLKQKPLYAEVEKLLIEMESSLPPAKGNRLF